MKAEEVFGGNVVELVVQDEVLNPRAKIMDQFRGPGIGRARSYSIQNELI